jgi:G:T-mismatch repair DNA endonuclease (very short patch repair protein)
MRKSNTIALSKANKIHNNFYNYDKFIYTNCYAKSIVKCLIHEEFLICPNNHLQGRGCPACGVLKFIQAKTSTTNKFIENSIIIHNNKYDYSQTIYVNAKTKVKIICRTHGKFLQEPKHHLSNVGCPRCSNNISKPETQWLNHLNIKLENRNIKIKVQGIPRGINVDAFIAETNTIYFFHGDFWHGNPKKYNPSEYNPINKKTFGELFSKTIENQKILELAGYHIIFIWESDWKENKAIFITAKEI